MKNWKELPDRNDSSDEWSTRIDFGHQLRNGRQVRQRSMADFDVVPDTGRNRWQLRLPTVKDERVTGLWVVDKEVEQIQPSIGQGSIDNHQIEGFGAVLHQAQQLFDALHRSHPKITQLVKQPLDPHTVKVLRIGNQDT
ncbi:hypothetical protein D3C84_621160 [compost metagenome]